MAIFNNLPCEVQEMILNSTEDAKSVANLVLASSSVYRVFAADPARTFKQLIEQEGFADDERILWPSAKHVSCDHPESLFTASNPKQWAKPPLCILTQFAEQSDEIRDAEENCLRDMYHYFHNSLDTVFGFYERADGVMVCIMGEHEDLMPVPFDLEPTFSVTERLRVHRALWRIRYLDAINPSLSLPEDLSRFSDAWHRLANHDPAGEAQKFCRSLTAWEQDEMMSVYVTLEPEPIVHYVSEICYGVNNYLALRAQNQQITGSIRSIAQSCHHTLTPPTRQWSDYQAHRLPAEVWLYCLSSSVPNSDWIGLHFPLCKATLRMGIAILDAQRWRDRLVIPQAQANTVTAAVNQDRHDVPATSSAGGLRARIEVLDAWKLLDNAIIEISNLMWEADEKQYVTGRRNRYWYDPTRRNITFKLCIKPVRSRTAHDDCEAYWRLFNGLAMKPLMSDEENNGWEDP